MCDLLSCGVLNVSILAHCTSRSSSPPNDERFCLRLTASSLILFFATFISGTKCFVSGFFLTVEHHCSMAPFYSLPYQSSILPSQPPDGCDIACVPGTREEQLTQRGCQGFRKRLRLGLASIRSVKWISITVRQRMHVCLVSPSGCLSLPPMSNRGYRQRQRELSATASLKELDSNNLTCVSTVVLRVHLCSFF